MIVVHHLNFSRSHRVIWLLEEFGLDYRLVRYERDAQFKAPPSLMKVHPLGKAPVIQDGDLTLAESSVILTYINERYGDGRLSPARGSNSYFLHDEWLQYAESTAALPIMMLRIGAINGGLSERLEQFIEPTLTKTLDYIAGAVRDQDYLMGREFTLADIQMAYPIEIAGHAGMLAEHQPIADYLSRLKARSAFARAVDIGGPMLP